MENIPITKNENETANQEALFIYGYLRKKYCNDNVKDLDIVLNSLCFSLIRMIHLHVGSKDRAAMIQIINNILRNGINEN